MKSLLFILKWGGKGARPFHVEEVKIFSLSSTGLWLANSLYNLYWAQMWV